MYSDTTRKKHSNGKREKAKSTYRKTMEARLGSKLQKIKNKTRSKSKSKSKSKSNQSAEEKSTSNSSFTVHKDIYYLNHLHQEWFDYPEEPKNKRYPRGKPVPFSAIDKFVVEDMKLQYGTPIPSNLSYDDSGNWKNDKAKLKEGDIIIDDNVPISRSHVEAWLVIKKNNKKHLVMFPMSDGDYDNGFSDGDTTNGQGLWIHPITKEYIQIPQT